MGTRGTNEHDESGIEELRALVNIAGWSRESALDGFDVMETVRILRACRALDLETLPDELTEPERRYAARHGRVSTSCLRRLYRENGLPETGRDWVGRPAKAEGK